MQEDQHDSSRYLLRFTQQPTVDDSRTVILREEASDVKHGFKPSERPIREYIKYGFIALDKPQGPTSHEAVAWLRKILSIERAGHSGTLDPMVSGVLPVGLESATKALSVLLLGPKEYVALARIHDSIPKEILQSTIDMFAGQIYQKPPQRSSVKRVTRTREIYSIETVQQTGNLILLRVLCESGTYIRKLIYDLGEVLKVGATMVELRRTKVCDLTEDKLVRLHDVFEAKAVLGESSNERKLRQVIVPIERAVSFLKQITIRDSAIDSVCHGAQLALPGILSFSSGVVKGEIVRIMSGKGELVAIAESQMNEVELRSAEHGIASLTRRVVMGSGTYPRMWGKSAKDKETEDIGESLLKKSILDSLEERDSEV